MALYADSFTILMLTLHTVHGKAFLSGRRAGATNLQAHSDCLFYLELYVSSQPPLNLSIFDFGKLVFLSTIGFFENTYLLQAFIMVHVVDDLQKGPKILLRIFVYGKLTTVFHQMF